MIRKLLNTLLILLTLAVIVNVLIYTGFTKEEALLASKPSHLKASAFYMVMFYSHIFFGAVALVTGIIQVRFTLNKVKPHRKLGKTYVLGVLFSGLSGLYIAFFANTGLVAQTGFGMLAVAWLTTTYLAYTNIRAKKIEAHQKWILRSMALTFAAIILRILLPASLISGISFSSAYPIIAWACWVPNLIINELFILKRPLKAVLN